MRFSFGKRDGLWSFGIVSSNASETHHITSIKTIMANTMLYDNVFGSSNIKISTDFFGNYILKVQTRCLTAPFFSRELVNYIKEHRLSSLESLIKMESELIRCFINENISISEGYQSILDEYTEWWTSGTLDNIDAERTDSIVELTCDRCWHSGEDIKEYKVGNMLVHLCSECYSTHIIKCPICGELHDLIDCNVIDGRVVCKNCIQKLAKKYKVSVYYCCVCKEYHTKQRYGKNRVNEHDWCCDETARTMSKCAGCGVLSTRMNTSFCGTKLCNACWAKKEKYLIKSYHNDPIPEFYVYNKEENKNQQVPAPNNGWGAFYGVELEVDSGGQRDDASEPTIKMLNDEVYAMRDGSLENGFEIITHPHTEQALYNMPWEKTFEYLVKSGYRSHDINTCGLHLHCNRMIFGLSPDEQAENVAKLMYFVENYREDFIKLSRREVQHINRWAKFYSDGMYKENLDYFKDIYYTYNRSSNHNDRYRAINLCKKKTIEFRLMRGTLKLDTFFATLDILITISKNASAMSIDDLDNKKKWLYGIKKETKKYIKENGLFEDVDLNRKPRDKIINPTELKTANIRISNGGDGRIGYESSNGNIIWVESPTVSRYGQVFEEEVELEDEYNEEENEEEDE